MYSHFLKGQLNAILGNDDYPEVCDDNQLINSELRNTSLHLIWKNVLNFWHGPSEFAGDFVQDTVVYD